MHVYRVRTSKQEYADYLRTDHWRDLKFAKLSAHPVCERCGRNQSTTVHHLRYRNLVDVVSSDLLATCAACHELIHRAIDFRVILDSGSRVDAVSVLEEAVSAAMSEQQTKVDIPCSVLSDLNTASVNVQRRACGITKQLHPGDFTKWAAVRITTKRLKLLKYIVRQSVAENSRIPMSKRAKRRDRESNKLARFVAKQNGLTADTATGGQAT